MQIMVLQENIFNFFFNIFRFIDDLIPINGGNEFGNLYNETYLLVQILKRKIHHPQRKLFYTFIFTQIRVNFKYAVKNDFFQPLVQKNFDSVEQLPLLYSLLKNVRFSYTEC